MPGIRADRILDELPLSSPPHFPSQCVSRLWQRNCRHRWAVVAAGNNRSEHKGQGCISVSRRRKRAGYELSVPRYKGRVRPVRLRANKQPDEEDSRGPRIRGGTRRTKTKNGRGRGVGQSVGGGLAYRLGVAWHLSVGQILLTQSPAYRHTQTILSRPPSVKDDKVEETRDRSPGACAATRRRFARKLILRETPGYRGAPTEQPGSADWAHTAQGVVLIVLHVTLWYFVHRSPFTRRSCDVAVM